MDDTSWMILRRQIREKAKRFSRGDLGVDFLLDLIECVAGSILANHVAYRSSGEMRVCLERPISKTRIWSVSELYTS